QLAMHVAHVRLAAAERHIQRAVVEFVLPLLVEPEHHVEHPGRSDPGPIQLAELARELPSRDRHLANASLEEVPGQRGFRKTEDLWAWIQTVELREQITQPREVRLVVALFR